MSPKGEWIEVDPSYQIVHAYRLVRVSPPEPWWERAWRDLKWRLFRRS